MIPKMVDILVHVNEDLNQPGQEALEKVVCDMPGVFSVHIPARKSHLMLVDYNPDWTSSKSIMGRVRASGLHAQLVGL